MAEQSPQEPYAGAEGRIVRSWRLTRAAWSVVRGDRTLGVLALLSAVAGLAGLAVILAATGAFSGAHVSNGRVVVVGVVLAYPLTFISVFLNTAIAAAAAAALDGRTLSFAEAMAVPMRRIGTVALWALIAAGVGMLLEQIASRLPLGASIATRLVSLAWSIASLFAVPVLALEDCSAPQCLKRSAHLVKDRWGEGISGSLIIAAWMIVATVPLAIVFAIALASSANGPATRDIVLAAAALAFLALIAIQTVVRQTFLVALYRYATTGASGRPFDERDLQAPFNRKRKRRFFR